MAVLVLVRVGECVQGKHSVEEEEENHDRGVSWHVLDVCCQASFPLLLLASRLVSRVICCSAPLFFSSFPPPRSSLTANRPRQTQTPRTDPFARKLLQIPECAATAWLRTLQACTITECLVFPTVSELRGAAASIQIVEQFFLGTDNFDANRFLIGSAGFHPDPRLGTQQRMGEILIGNQLPADVGLRVHFRGEPFSIGTITAVRLPPTWPAPAVLAIFSKTSRPSERDTSPWAVLALARLIFPGLARHARHA
jgi:hypothetical protein